MAILQGGQMAESRRAKAQAEEEKEHRQVPEESGRLIFSLLGR